MEKRTFTHLGLGLLLVGLVFGVGNLLPYYLYDVGASWFYNSNFLVFLLSAVLYGLGTLILYLVTRSLPRMPHLPRKKMRLLQIGGFFCANRGVSFVLSLVGAILAAIAWMVLKGPNGLSQYLEDMGLSLVGAWTPAMWYNMVSICILAPTIEELMFRKLLMEPLRPFGDTVAILYSGIAFGLLHMDIQQITYTIAAGIFLGYIMVRTNNIWYCVLQHFLFNASSFILMPIMSNINNNPAAILTLIVLVLGIIGLSILGIVLFFVFIGRIKLDKAPYAFSQRVGFKMAVFTGWGWPYILVCLGVAVTHILLS